MKRSYSILTKIIIVFTLSLIIYFSLLDYLLSKQSYEWYSYELTFMRATSLILLNAYFFILVFIIKISVFNKLYLVLIIFGIIAWNLSHFHSILELNLLSDTIDDFLEIILFISTSIVAPGLLIVIAYYIKKFTSKFEGNFVGKYHLHEGLFGIILFGLGLLFFAISAYISQLDIFLKEFKVYLAIIMILLYFLLFFGGFFILRDFNDIIHLKFVNKIPTTKNIPKQDGIIFNSLNHDNISFFRFSKIYIFPLGAFLTGISFTMVIYSNKFIPRDVLSSRETINLGYFLSFLAGALIGYDWVRVFKRFFPNQYEEIELKIIELQKNDV